jgi:hypothetical protein
VRTIALDDLPLVGALDQQVTDTGLTLRRLPAWTRPQIVDIQFMAMVSMSAGVRVEFASDTTVIELDLMLTLLQVGDRALKPATFDLVVDDEVAASSSTTVGTVIHYDPRTGGAELDPGEPTTVRFERPSGPAPAALEIWFPQDAVVEVRAARVDDDAVVEPLDRPRPRWIHHGSSISHCLEARRPTETWPAIAARRAEVDLLDLAFAGQCMLDQVVARTIRDLPADLISLKMGINVVNGDTLRERTFVTALHGFLDTVRDGHPTAPIAVVSPIVCPAVEDHPGPTVVGDDGMVDVVARAPELSVGALTLRRIRDLEAEVVRARRDAGDQHLHLVSGLELFGPNDVDSLYDGLHPDADGYKRIGERFHAVAFGPGGPLAPSG